MEFSIGHILSLAEDLLQGLAHGVPTFPDSGVLHGWEVTRACASACVAAQVACICNAKLHLSMHGSQRCMYLCYWVIFGNICKHACGHVGICDLRGGVGAVEQPKEEVGCRRGRLGRTEEGVQPSRKAL